MDWIHDRLRTVEIFSVDGIELAARMDDEPGTLIFADPPFIQEGGIYRHSFKTSTGGGLFGGEAERDDHDRLAAVLNAKAESMVVVEYHRDDRLDHLYPKDRWHRVQLSSRDQLSMGSTKRSILLINGPAMEALS